MVRVENYLLDNKSLKIIQRKDMFNFSLDTILLANFVFLGKKVKNILDIGTNNGAIPLLLSQRTAAIITGVEIQEEAYVLAQENVIINNLQDQVHIVCQDILEYVKVAKKFNVVVCNPPFFKLSEKSNLNDSKFLQIARHELRITLEEIIASASKVLENNGRFALVHRPERLMEILELMKKYSIEPKRLRMVYPRVNQSAHMILIEGRYQGNPGLIIEQPLYAHDQNGDYSLEVQAMFLGGSLCKE